MKDEVRKLRTELPRMPPEAGRQAVSLIAWIVLGAYVVGWLVTANRLFATHEARRYEWRERAYRLQTAFGYALLALFWPLSIVYLIIRGKAVPKEKG